MATVLFDETFVSKRSGKRIYDCDTIAVAEAHDNELMWFHAGYGFMRLYRLLQVDANNFIAKDMHIGCYTSSDSWDSWQKNPELALGDASPRKVESGINWNWYYSDSESDLHKWYEEMFGKPITYDWFIMRIAENKFGFRLHK